jgi:hypothetical protein
MKSTILKISAISLLMFVIIAGCERDKVKDEIPKTLIEGKWILVGYGDDSTNEFTAEPESEPISSYLIIDTDMIKAFSYRNENELYYNVEGEIVKVTSIGGPTKMGSDTDWGWNFLITIDDVFKYSINNDELILYFEAHKFMKLKKDPAYISD